MNFTTNITERDKKLLYFLGIALFLVGFFYFGLIPAWKGFVTAGEELTTAQATREDMEYQIALKPSAEAQAAAVRAEVDAEAAKIYHVLTNDEIDALVTSLELKHGLSPVSLDIAGAEAESMEPYVASPLTITGSSADASAAEGYAADGFVQSAAVTATATGTRDQFSELLNDIAANYPAARLLSFSVTDSATLNTEAEVDTVSQLTYRLTLSMCGEE